MIRPLLLEAPKPPRQRLPARVRAFFTARWPGRIVAGAVAVHLLDALLSLVRDGPVRAVEIRKINGATLAESPDAGWVRQAAIDAGFTDSYRGLAFRRA